MFHDWKETKCSITTHSLCLKSPGSHFLCPWDGVSWSTHTDFLMENLMTFQQEAGEVLLEAAAASSCDFCDRNLVGLIPLVFLGERFPLLPLGMAQQWQLLVQCWWCSLSIRSVC